MNTELRYQMKSVVFNSVQGSSINFPDFRDALEVGALDAVAEVCIFRRGMRATAELFYRYADAVVAELPLDGLHPATKPVAVPVVAKPRWSPPDYWPAVAVPVALALGLIVGASV